VIVTLASFTELQTKLAGISPVGADQIVQIKCDVLNSLPTDDIRNVDVEEEAADMESRPNESLFEPIKADLPLPMRITYVDLSDLALCPRIPRLVLYRSEFEELTRGIEESNESDKDEAHYQFVTGTPGIGMYLRRFRSVFLMN
jgi:hypothetical protein